MAWIIGSVQNISLEEGLPERRRPSRDRIARDDDLDVGRHRRCDRAGIGYKKVVPGTNTPARP